MKKTKLLLLTALTAISLTACGHGDTNGLPSGGKDVDASSEAGKSEVKQHLEDVVEAYDDKGITAFGSEVEVKNTNFTLKQKDGGEVSLKNFGFKSQVAFKDNEASFTLKDTTGALNINNLDLLEKKINRSLSFNGISCGAYFTNKNLYVDYSSQGLRTFISGAETFLGGVITDLGFTNSTVAALILAMTQVDVSEIFDDKGIHLNDFIDKQASSRKIAIPADLTYSVSDIASQIVGNITNENIDQVVTEFSSLYQATEAFKFVAYANKGFGIEAKFDKADLERTIKDFVSEEQYTQVKETLDTYLTSFDLSAYVLFNEKAYLSEMGCKVKVEAKADTVNETELNITVSAETEEKVTFKYNNDVNVNLPSANELAKYEVINLQPKAEPQE